MFMPSVVAVGQGDVVDVGREHRGDRGARLGHALEHLVEVRRRAPRPVGQLVVGELGHRGRRLGRQRARTEPVFR